MESLPAAGPEASPFAEDPRLVVDVVVLEVGLDGSVFDGDIVEEEGTDGDVDVEDDCCCGCCWVFERESGEGVIFVLEAVLLGLYGDDDEDEVGEDEGDDDDIRGVSVVVVVD